MRDLDATLPSVCVRHGRAGATIRTAHVPSRPRIPWDDLSVPRKILFQFQPWANFKRIQARWSLMIWTETQWHTCSSCARYLVGRRVLSALLVVLTAIVITGPISPLMTWIPEGPRSLLLILGILLAIPTIRSMSTYKELFRAITSEDGTELIIREPHPTFAREAIALGARGHGSNDLAIEH